VVAEKELDAAAIADLRQEAQYCIQIIEIFR
jgi:hypothetical protein